MAIFSKWKPKTVVGKLVKGATIGLGAAATVATGVGAIAGIATGGGLLAGAIAGGQTAIKGVKSVLGGAKTVTSKIAGSAINLVTGNTAEQRAIIKDVKEEAKTAKEAQEFVQKLMNLGLSREEAYAKAGMSLSEETGTSDQSGVIGFLTGARKGKDGEIKGVVKSNITPLLLGGLALLFLPKLFKR